MMKSFALFALALLLTAGVFVTAQQVDAGTTYADNKADCATMCADEIKTGCVDEVKTGCDSEGMQMHSSAEKKADGCCPGTEKHHGGI